MKPFTPRSSAGFSLIEMIGVMAVMSILAAVIAPNVLRSIDRASMSAEVQNTKTLGDQVKSYLYANGSVPPVATWNTSLATYAGLGPTDVLTNKWQMNRVYILEPFVLPLLVPQRALILSSMRTGLALPTAANISTSPQFTTIWNTTDGSVPANTSWAGWAAWGAVANSGNYLVITRINLAAEYRTITLNYTLSVPPPPAPPAQVLYTYKIGTGAATSGLITKSGAPAILSNLVPGEIISLYKDSTLTTLDYSYVVSTGSKTFTFDGTHWAPY